MERTIKSFIDGIYREVINSYNYNCLVQTEQEMVLCDPEDGNTFKVIAIGPNEIIVEEIEFKYE